MGFYLNKKLPFIHIFHNVFKPSMVVQTQSWDSDLDWLTKTKEMEPQKEKKVSVASSKSDESTLSSGNEDEQKLESEEYNPYDYSQDEFEDDADADYELDQMRTEEEKMELEENTMRNIVETDADGDNYSVQDKMIKANEELKSTDDTPSRERKVIFKPKLVEFKAPAGEESSSDDDAIAETPERKVLFSEDLPAAVEKGEEKNEKILEEILNEDNKFVNNKYLLLACTVVALVGICYLKSRK